MNPADESRVIYSLLSNLKLSETPETFKLLGAQDKIESLFSSLKQKEIALELIPLNSKARHKSEGKLLKEALKHWFVPTEMVREYYGDDVAMYYSWMNFLISIYLLLTRV